MVLRDSGADSSLTPILSIPYLDIASGMQVGVRGPSGSGKSSLLYLLAGLARPSAGVIRCFGTDLGALTEGARDAWRRCQVGFIFQEFHLVPELDAVDNIALPLSFGAGGSASWTDASSLARRLGLDDRSRPVRLMSRGEQQRVAVARALLMKPRLILADEPTASLDAAHGEQIADLIIAEAKAIGATLICASHDEKLLARLPRRLSLAEGRLAADEGAP